MSDHDPDKEHAAAMEQTGFWGKAGSGCLVYARNTGRFMVGLRSEGVLEPFTWGTWGGAVPQGMSPEDSALLELSEETGFSEDVELVHVYQFRDEKSGFIYDNYLAVIDDEFIPSLNWENVDFGWFGQGEFPSPLHDGLRVLLENVPNLEALIRCNRPRV